jgi:hypothetical protein
MSGADQRAFSDVPFWIAALLATSLGLQLAWQATSATGASSADLPPAPRAEALKLAALAEEPAAARLAMLYVQSFDYSGANPIPYRKLDYARLTAWLNAILALDPRSDYPLFSAARIYAENPDPARSREVLEFVYRAFLDDPDRRWPWLAQAALLAKHRLGDLPLALRYARAVDRLTKDPKMPAWARQMEIFILEDMNELEAARIMLGGLLASGQIKDPAEARFLAERLKDLERRLGQPKG